MTLSQIEAPVYLLGKGANGELVASQITENTERENFMPDSDNFLPEVNSKWQFQHSHSVASAYSDCAPLDQSKLLRVRPYQEAIAFLG